MGDITMKKCRICGKSIAVLYPTRWAYKRGCSQDGHQFAYFCSWGCMRKDEAKRNEKRKNRQAVRIEKELNREKEELAMTQKRNQKEVARGILDAIEKGENPREYLKRIGYANPTDQLANVKRWAEKNEPEMAEKLKKLAPVKKGPPIRKTAAKKPAKAEVQVAKKLPEEAKEAGKKISRDEVIRKMKEQKPAQAEVQAAEIRISMEELKAMLNEIALECQKERVTLIGANEVNTLMFANAQVAAYNSGINAMRKKTEEVMAAKWGV